MYTSIDGLDIYYQTSGKGKALVMLHGWGQDVSTFWPVLNELKTSFKIILIDLPGFGRSDTPSKPFFVHDYSKIIAEFIKHQKIDRPVLLGHSVGGRIGIKLSATQPEIIDKLILEASAGIRPKQDPFKLLVYPIAKIFNAIIPNIFGIKEMIRYRFYRAIESDYINAGPMKETLTNIINEDLTFDLQKIQTETLLLWGENDPTSEASLKHGKKMYRLIKNAKLEIFENVGHFPHLEAPAKFIHYVKDFV